MLLFLISRVATLVILLHDSYCTVHNIASVAISSDIDAVGYIIETVELIVHCTV